MAADQYLQAAAGQLQRAAQAVKNDADKAHAEFMTYERQVTHDIDGMETQLRAIAVKMTAPQEPGVTATLNLQYRNLKGNIEDKRRELEAKRVEMQGTVQGKQGAISGLMDQAKGLQGQASDPTLR